MKKVLIAFGLGMLTIIAFIVAGAALMGVVLGALGFLQLLGLSQGWAMTVFLFLMFSSAMGFAYYKDPPKWIKAKSYWGD